MDDYRMPMNLKLIDNSLEALPAPTVIARESANTDLTILGLSDQSGSQALRMVGDIRKLLDTLGTTLLISGSSHFEEFDLEINEKRVIEDEEEVVADRIALPELPPVYNDWLAQDLQKIDERNRKALSAFYQQSFVPYFRENRLIIQDMESVINGVINTLRKEWEQYDDKFRRRKSLQKAVNELYYRTKNLLEEVPEYHLTTQKEALEKGIIWYFKQLEVDIMRFPREAKVVIPREELIAAPQDSLSIRWLKLRSRITI